MPRKKMPTSLETKEMHIVNSMKQNCHTYQICRNESWIIPVIDKDVQIKNLCTLLVGTLTSTVTFENILVLPGKNEDTHVLWSSSSGHLCVCVCIHLCVFNLQCHLYWVGTFSWPCFWVLCYFKCVYLCTNFVLA